MNPTPATHMASMSIITNMMTKLDKSVEALEGLHDRQPVKRKRVVIKHRAHGIFHNTRVGHSRLSGKQLSAPRRNGVPQAMA